MAPVLTKVAVPLLAGPATLVIAVLPFTFEISEPMKELKVWGARLLNRQ